MLVRTAGARIVGEVTQRRERPDPGHFVGEGKAREIGQEATELGADVVVIDHDLSPAQVKNLEKAVGFKVLDRTEIILDIFATHARSRQAKLQVELAQLEYTLPRLRGQWQHLERIAGGRGGGGSAGTGGGSGPGGGAMSGAVGGLGTRGPGEKQLEVDRRMARDQIVKLKRDLAEIDKRKTREVRGRAENFTVALVGYTNAGKSTLMKRLTGADVLIEDKLFSTLDTKTHTWTLDGGMRVLISDTVGFIRSLPHHLVASFHATLEEVVYADLLLHVVDASHPDAEGHIAAVDAVLEKLGCADKDRLVVLNKMDAVRNRVGHELLRSKHPGALEISARMNNGLDVLRDAVGARLERTHVDVAIDVPAGDGRLLAYMMEHGRILERTLDGETWKIRARMAPWHASRLPRNGAPDAPARTLRTAARSKKR
ncbi:MAG: GTPase HflX [Candidatus Brocadiae bacterium]|nr:GTPase HflX [Candidatus Brocadiia bacterium]